MRHLRDDTVLILDGEVRVYRRERSRRWQAAFSIDGKAIRISTGKKDLNEAKEIARDTYLEYKFRHKNDCLGPLELCQYILAKGVRKHGSKALF